MSARKRAAGPGLGETSPRRLLTAFGLLVDAYRILCERAATAGPDRDRARDWIARYEAEFPSVSFAEGGGPSEDSRPATGRAA